MFSLLKSQHRDLCAVQGFFTITLFITFNFCVKRKIVLFKSDSLIQLKLAPVVEPEVVHVGVPGLAVQKCVVIRHLK